MIREHRITALPYFPFLEIKAIMKTYPAIKSMVTFFVNNKHALS